jgi:hypothetical protein
MVYKEVLRRNSKVRKPSPHPESGWFVQQGGELDRRSAQEELARKSSWYARYLQSHPG